MTHDRDSGCSQRAHAVNVKPLQHDEDFSRTTHRYSKTLKLWSAAGVLTACSGAGGSISNADASAGCGRGRRRFKFTLAGVGLQISQIIVIIARALPVSIRIPFIVVAFTAFVGCFFVYIVIRSVKTVLRCGG
jgi:hypothetical protein